MKTIEDLFAVAGARDLDAIIKNIEEARQITRELHDEHTALVIYNRKLRLVIILCEKAFEMIELQGSMFVTRKVTETIAQVKDQIAKAETAIAASREICENKTGRK